MSEKSTIGLAQAGILAIVPVFAILGAVLLAPLLATIEAQFKDVPHASTLVPLLLTAPALCLALLSPLAGILSDRFGARRVLLLSYALYGVAGTAPAWLQSLHAIFVSRLLVGVAEAGLVTASTALLAGYFSGTQRQKWFAWQSIIMPILAALVVAAVAGLAHLNWRWSFLVYGSSLLMMVVAHVLLPKNSEAHQASYQRLRLLPWKQSLMLIGIAVPGSMAFYAGPVQIAYLLSAKGHADPGTASWVTAVALLFGPPLILVARRFPRATVGQLVAIGMLVMGFGLLAMANSSSVAGITLGYVCQQAGGALMFSTGVNYIVSLARPEERGLYSGAWGFVYMLAQFCTPFVTHGLNSALGSRTQAVMTLGLLSAACALWLVVAPPLRSRPMAGERSPEGKG